MERKKKKKKKEEAVTTLFDLRAYVASLICTFFNSGSALWFNLGLAVISDLNQYYIYTWYLFETFFMSTHFCHLKNDFESMLKKKSQQRK